MYFKVKQTLSGSWVQINSTTSQSGGISPSFIGLDPSESYQVKHEITAILPYSCNYSPYKTKTIQ